MFLPISKNWISILGTYLPLTLHHLSNPRPHPLRLLPRMPHQRITHNLHVLQPRLEELELEPAQHVRKRKVHFAVCEAI